MFYGGTMDLTFDSSTVHVCQIVRLEHCSVSPPICISGGMWHGVTWWLNHWAVGLELRGFLSPSGQGALTQLYSGNIKKAYLCVLQRGH